MNKNTGFFGAQTKTKYIIALLVIAGFGLRLFMARADPYLHDWDERFHALVAENMMHHPFTPMLRVNPVIPYNPYNWCDNHIWVHKQPLFLWQMALSMRISGVSERTMRLPSVLMGTLMILLLFRIAVLFTGNRLTSLIAAGLLAFSNVFINLSAGIQGQDHNDLAFCFYVLASIWAYTEYIRSPKWYWVLLVGLFSGCAVLNKWLLGWLVFLGWGVHCLLRIRKERMRKEWLHLVIALFVSCVIFLPWQWYIFHAFPKEAAYEMAFNRRHITEALEGHDGTVFYYVSHFYAVFGNGCWLLLVPGMMAALLQQQALNRYLLVSFLVEILFVFCFFSFAVKSKGYNYFLFVAPLCLLFIAGFLSLLIRKLKKAYWVVPFLLLVLFDVLNPVKIMQHLSAANMERADKIYNTQIYKKAKEYLPGNIRIVMNLDALEDIPFMFYNSSCSAYDGVLSEADMNRLAKKKVPVAAFKNHGTYILPGYVLRYPYLYIIPLDLR